MCPVSQIIISDKQQKFSSTLIDPISKAHIFLLLMSCYWRVFGIVPEMEQIGSGKNKFKVAVSRML